MARKDEFPLAPQERFSGISSSCPEIVRHLLAGSELKEMLAEIVATGIQDLGADRGAVYLYDAEYTRLNVGYSCGLSEEYLSFLMDVFHEVPGFRLIQESAPFVVVQDAWYESEARVVHEWASREGFRSLIILPLVYRQQRIGALAFYANETRSWSPEEIQAFQQLADLATIAVAYTAIQRQAQCWRDVLAAFQEIDRQILSTQDLEGVLSAISNALQRILGVSTLYIGLYDPLLNEVYFPILIDQGEKNNHRCAGNSPKGPDWPDG